MAQPGGCEVRRRHRRGNDIDGALILGLGCASKRQRHRPEAKVEDAVAEPRLVVVIALRLCGRHDLDLPRVEAEAFILKKAVTARPEQGSPHLVTTVIG